MDLPTKIFQGFIGLIVWFATNIQKAFPIFEKIFNKLKSIFHKIKPTDNTDVLILAGDIGNPYDNKYKLF